MSVERARLRSQSRGSHDVRRRRGGEPIKRVELCQTVSRSMQTAIALCLFQRMPKSIHWQAWTTDFARCPRYYLHAHEQTCFRATLVLSIGYMQRAGEQSECVRSGVYCGVYDAEKHYKTTSTESLFDKWICKRAIVNSTSQEKFWDKSSKSER